MPNIAIGEHLRGPNAEQFRIIGFLGHGAFGEVYQAVGEDTGMVVAAKLLPITSLESESSKTALLNEIKAAQHVAHPNVVKVLHVDDGKSSSVGPFVFMEYVPGGTLARLLRVNTQSDSHIPVDRAIEMMIDVARGAQAINEKLVHRDIKPDNILIEDGKLKIGDFGISKLVDESTRTHTFKGGQHIAYMAPEAWHNEDNTFKLDVYSVGLVFYQILALKHPLADKVRDKSSFLDWEHAHLYVSCPDIRTLRKEVPLAISQLLIRMVSKRPSERPGWEEILAILGKPEPLSASDHPSVRAAVEAVVARKQKEQDELQKAAQRQSELERQVALYSYSCDELLKQFEPVVEQFNRQCQHGQITLDRERGFNLYRIPSGRSIEVSFFGPGSGIKIRGGEVIGGGWIGFSGGRSANLVLLKQGGDDLYGRWSACEIGVMAMADPRKLIGRFGITERTTIPFGFKDEYFYDQIRYATGIMHAFTYTFSENAVDFFARLLLEASG
jgi:eukaryotic-like serine/threonine-protein kinase